MPRPNQPPNAPQVPKPYEFVTFPAKSPSLKPPAGHHAYLNKRVHGILHLELTVETALHVSTGTVMMGSDVGQSGIPLIKTMQTGNDKLTIPGSSLKGVVRSIYEAITNSTLAVVTGRYKNQMPKDRLPCRNKEKLCPASQVFGALDWQGLISFQDAKCVKKGFAPGFMPSLYRPRPDQRRKYFNPVSRKFYYHAIKAVGGGQKGIPTQQASRQYTFETKLQFMNLTSAELGTLLVALGQDKNYPFSLKVGAGKPIGMGTMTVKIARMEKLESMRDRYSDYNSEAPTLSESELQTFMKQAIAAAHQQKLVELDQLKQLQKILAYPTDRNAPSGMY
jgi:hypothetical protein